MPIELDEVVCEFCGNEQTEDVDDDVFICESCGEMFHREDPST